MTLVFIYFQGLYRANNIIQAVKRSQYHSPRSAIQRVILQKCVHVKQTKRSLKSGLEISPMQFVGGSALLILEILNLLLKGKKLNFTFFFSTLSSKCFRLHFFLKMPKCFTRQFAFKGLSLKSLREHICSLHRPLVRDVRQGRSLFE